MALLHDVFRVQDTHQLTTVVFKLAVLLFVFMLLKTFSKPVFKNSLPTVDKSICVQRYIPKVFVQLSLLLYTNITKVFVQLSLFLFNN